VTSNELSPPCAVNQPRCRWPPRSIRRRTSRTICIWTTKASGPDPRLELTILRIIVYSGCEVSYATVDRVVNRHWSVFTTLYTSSRLTAMNEWIKIEPYPSFPHPTAHWGRNSRVSHAKSILSSIMKYVSLKPCLTAYKGSTENAVPAGKWRTKSQGWKMRDLENWNWWTEIQYTRSNVSIILLENSDIKSNVS